MPESNAVVLGSSASIARPGTRVLLGFLFLQRFSCETRALGSAAPETGDL
ncbi:MAG TPA: hypothetical protein VMN76_09530 [Acidobacteriota bacterium]|nr:hypothetical protein [Acidobacteriota bacterium]